MNSPRTSVQAGLPATAPRVPIALEQIQVASPCHIAWDGMAGDDRVRLCRRCAKNVYNLSGMSRTEAEALVTRMEGRLCVRYYRRADGTMLTADCPVGVAALRRLHWPLLVVGGLAAAFLVAALGLVTAGVFVLPRMRDAGANFPGPIQTIVDWISPPVICVQGEPMPIMPPPALPIPDAPREEELPDHG
jgi:hypothetical protein